jgi:uncharacterized protein YcnI
MTTRMRVVSRVLMTAATTATLSLTSWACAAVASAHVEVNADDAVRGDTSVLTFRVPGESDTGSLTTQFSVKLPSTASARTEAMPGWTARLDRDAVKGTFTKVTWTATPTVGISSEQFALFRISVTLPDADTVSFPATQTYADGMVVVWDQPPLPGGGEPEHPAPMLTLTGGPAPTSTAPTAAPVAEKQQPAPSSDNTARALAGGALLLAALGIGVALARRRT